MLCASALVILTLGIVFSVCVCSSACWYVCTRAVPGLSIALFVNNLFIAALEINLQSIMLSWILSKMPRMESDGLCKGRNDKEGEIGCRVASRLSKPFGKWNRIRTDFIQVQIKGK